MDSSEFIESVSRRYKEENKKLKNGTKLLTAIQTDPDKMLHLFDANWPEIYPLFANRLDQNPYHDFVSFLKNNLSAFLSTQDPDITLDFDEDKTIADPEFVLSYKTHKILLFNVFSKTFDRYMDDNAIAAIQQSIRATYSQLVEKKRKQDQVLSTQQDMFLSFLKKHQYQQLFYAALRYPSIRNYLRFDALSRQGEIDMLKQKLRSLYAESNAIYHYESDQESLYQKYSMMLKNEYGYQPANETA